MHRTRTIVTGKEDKVLEIERSGKHLKYVANARIGNPQLLISTKARLSCFMCVVSRMSQASVRLQGSHGTL